MTAPLAAALARDQVERIATEEQIDEPYRPTFVEADVPLPTTEVGSCPWCHNPVTIDPLVTQQVCPGCNARFATEAALRPEPVGRRRRRYRLRLRPSGGAARVAATIVSYVLFALLIGPGALLPAGLLTISVIGLMIAVEERP